MPYRPELLRYPECVHASPELCRRNFVADALLRPLPDHLSGSEQIGLELFCPPIGFEILKRLVLLSDFVRLSYWLYLRTKQKLVVIRRNR